MLSSVLLTVVFGASMGSISVEVVGPYSGLISKSNSGSFSICWYPMPACAATVISLLDGRWLGTFGVDTCIAEFTGEASDDSLLLLMRLETRLDLVCPF